jgi:hypothetical protein
MVDNIGSEIDADEFKSARFDFEHFGSDDGGEIAEEEQKPSQVEKESGYIDSLKKWFWG